MCNLFNDLLDAICAKVLTFFFGSATGNRLFSVKSTLIIMSIISVTVQQMVGLGGDAMSMQTEKKNNNSETSRTAL